ncbi:MAG: type II secretion system protein [Planctomycetes bacterium]|nr:type II secretion system protein [Planctomycetota bacterium]
MSKQRGGWLLIESVIAMGVIALTMAVFMAAQQSSGDYNRYQFMRQKCAAAAQARLDCLRATGELIVPAEMKRLWPEVDVTVELSPGEGDWQGLTLVKAVAAANVKGLPVRVELAGYVKMDESKK